LAAAAICVATNPLISDLPKDGDLDERLEYFNFKALMRHNYYRRMHGVRQLTLDTRLATLAQQVAESSAKAGHFITDRPTAGGVAPGALYGSVTGYTNFNGQNLTDLWYLSKDADGKRNYGQVIWKNTKQAGFGVAKDENGQLFMVGLYFPPGNIVGQEKDNVLPTLDERRRIFNSKKPAWNTNKFVNIQHARVGLQRDDQVEDTDNELIGEPKILDQFFSSLLDKLNEIKIEPEVALKGLEWINRISQQLDVLRRDIHFK
jgi:hypothetical protein